MNIDFGKLTDGQLRELEKNIELEKEKRKNGFLYKYQLSISDKKYCKERKLINAYIKKQGFEFDTHYVRTNPMSTIQSYVFRTADYILGNFTARKRADNEGFLSLNGSLIKVDNNDEYEQFYNELYSVIDKWVDKKFNDYGLVEEEEIQE